ncbi:MAG TPA: cereblon family protein [Myxococcales bacterium]
MLREDAQQAGGAVSTGDDSFWRCVACGAEVARDGDRIPLDGVATRAFMNPDGFEYVIAGFTHATGCRDASEPSAYWSWFPGCSWQVCLCRACGAHLGWRFSGRADFYGLSVDRLTAP